jgi:hypothetical protein
MTVGTQLRGGEPARRKLVAAVGHVLPAEHAEAQHLLRRELRLEPRREVAPDRLGPVVDVALLHPVVDDDAPPHWLASVRGVSTRRSTSYPLARAASRAAAIDSSSSCGARARIHRYFRPGSPTTAQE